MVCNLNALDVVIRGDYMVGQAGKTEAVMARDIYDIAKEIAQEAVSIAQCAGYEVKPERDLFFRSDVSNLADDIADWLERHMRVEPVIS